jgi:hypothetical protein
MKKSVENPYQAQYTDPEVRSYQNNPAIQALPPILTLEEVVKLMKRDIDYQEEDRFQPPHLRLHALQNVLYWRQPLNRHIELEQRTSIIIRQGYIGRNPINNAYWQNVEAERKALRENAILQPQTPSTSVSFALLGDSGTGKSSAIQVVLNTYPPYIVHTEYKGQPFNYIQIPYLIIECPHDGSLKGLCHNILRAVDELIGTNYYQLYARNGRASVVELIGHIHTIAKAHLLGLLVIDEIQNLREAKSNNAEQMLNYFVYMTNYLHLPIILIGTPRAISVLSSALRQARRMSGQGDMIFRRMTPGEEWSLLIKSMWKYQYVQNPLPLTQEIIQAFYEESQGIIDLVVKLFILAQIRAITTGEEVITPNTIHSVTDNMILLQRFVKALRNGQEPGVIYDDLYEHVNIQNHIEMSLKQQSTLTNNLTIREATPQPISRTPAVEKIASKNTATNRTLKDAKPRIKAKKNPRVIKQGGLLEAFEVSQQEAISVYDALWKSDLIKSVEEFLTGMI